MHTHIAFRILFFCGVLQLIGCGDGTEKSESIPQPSKSNTYTLSGGVAKGALINATIKIFLLDEGGNISDPTPVLITQTDELGQFVSQIPVSDKPRLIQSFGGSYIDEADQEPDVALKRRINFESEQGLSSIIFPNQTSVALTIASTAIIKKTKAESTSNNFFSTLALNQQNAVRAFGFDVINVVPADTLSPAATASTSQLQYALVLGGLANLVNRIALELGFAEPNFDTILAIIDDLSDGIIDGQYQGVPLSYTNKYGVQQTLPQDIDFNEQISRFKNNNTDNFSTTPTFEVNEEVLKEPQITNIAPEISVSSSVSLTGQQSLNITASITDPDGSITDFSWQQTAGPTLALTGTNSLTLGITAPDVVLDSQATLTLSATDNLGAVSVKQITVEIIARNRAPEIALTTSIKANEQELVSIDATITDSDGTITDITWTQTSGPSVNLNGSSTSSIRFTAPIVLIQTDIVLKVQATDDEGESTTATTTITIVPINSPPAVFAGNSQVIFSEKSATLIGQASDEDGTIVSINWQQISGPSALISNATSLETLITAPKVTLISDLLFSLTATDNEGASSTAQVSVIVKPLIPPVVFAGEDQIVESNTSVSLTGLATDSDGIIASYQWVQLSGPTVNLSNTSTANTTFLAPTVTTKQLLVFSLTATDDSGASGSDSIQITVEPPNQIPTINAGTDQTIHSALMVTLSGTASDTDGSIASYAWSQTAGPAVTLSTPNAAVTNFTAPTVSSDTILTFTLTVTDDDGATASDSVQVTVQPPNIAPVITLNSSQSVERNQSISITASASDSDGTIKSYAWQQTSGQTVSVSGKTTSTISFIAPNISTDTTLTFSLTVTDDDNASSSANTSVLVFVPNTPPTVNAGADQTLHTGRTVTLSGSASDDGSIASYLWTLVSGNLSVTLANPNSAITTFYAAGVEVDETLIFRLTVTDNSGLTGSDTVSITIQPPNNNPSVNAGADTTAISNQTITLNGTASDSDGTIASYTWTKIVNGSPEALSNANNANLTITTPDPSNGETLTYKLTVTDDDGATAEDSIDVVVYSPRFNWSFATAAAINSSPAIDSSGNVIFGSDDNKLYALDSSGNKLWEFATANKITASPLIDDTDNIYIGSQDKKFYKIDNTGTQLWQQTTANPILVEAALLASDNLLFVSDSTINVVDSSGSAVWNFTHPSTNSYSAAISSSSDNVLIISSDKYLYEFSYSNGSSGPQDSELTPAITNSSPIADNTYVYFGASDSNVHTYGYNEGFYSYWQSPFTTTAAVYSPAILSTNSDVYIGSTDNIFYAIDSSGSELWRFTTNGAIYGSALLLNDGSTNNLVIFGSSDGYLYALNAADGVLVWKFKSGGAIKSSPNFKGNNIYVTSTDGKIYCITISGYTLATSSWPMFRRDPKHQAKLSSQALGG
ncbi:PKD domain-containing protein [Pseudoalteromonas tunicata]|jgi:outer membrane protein assembly factor BamB|uniref:PKD domain-containing protein n=1 Tax=Pseudoalteromonas tunicata TaxID=314281 RepID=UPI000322CB49|nr:PQQ-binding-like beta-propeller repeat protein [Pseudoalteromonas tunicata]AXT33094.1 hypothetical protein D1819_19945 [Pseudoalteromonas tunicata]